MVMIEEQEPILEPYGGVYEVSQAARIVQTTINYPDGIMRVNNRHILRWIRKGLALPRLEELEGRDLQLAFPDLVSMRVVALMRVVGVSWQAIYKAERWLRQHTRSPRPFATRDFWTAAREIFIEHEGQLIAASMGGQLPFLPLMETYLFPVAGMTFDSHGLADSWEPADAVLLKPTIQFGAPCVRGTRITTNAIWGMCEAGDSPEFVARVYDIELEQVESAISWEKRLASAA